MIRPAVRPSQTQRGSFSRAGKFSHQTSRIRMAAISGPCGSLVRASIILFEEVYLTFGTVRHGSTLAIVVRVGSRAFDVSGILGQEPICFGTFEWS